MYRIFTRFYSDTAFGRPGCGKYSVSEHMSSASETGASAAAAVEAVDGCAEERFLQLDERKDGNFFGTISHALF